MPRPPWAGGGGTTPIITGFSDDSGVHGDGLTNDSTITITGTSDPNVEVAFYADGVLLGTTTADADGDWTFTTAELADGSHSFTAVGKGKDKTSSPLTVQIDTATEAPEITSAVEEPAGLRLAGTAEAGASIDIYRDGSLLGTVMADASGIWTYVDGAFGGDSVTYTAVSTDAAGNSAETAGGFEFPPPENTAPVITSAASASVAENQTAVLDVEASDDAAGLSYGISGGADRTLFVIDPATGVLSFASAPDFENPADADLDNVYQVEVTVTDAGGLTDSQTIAVTVTDMAENTAPVITSAASASVAENQTAVLDVEASDDAAGLSYGISGGADRTLFVIDPATGVLSFASAPDFENPADADLDNVYQVEVTVTDAGGLTDSQTIAVTVTDMAENAPPAIDLDGSAAGTGYSVTFAENGGAVAIADTDAAVSDDDDTRMASASVILTNAQAGDELQVNLAGLPAGISVDPASTATNIILTGSATLADYQTALRQVLFNNTSENPGTDSRSIEVTVSDGLATSDVAVTTVSIDSAPDAVGDSASTIRDTAVTTADVLVNDDPGDAPVSIIGFDAVSVQGGSVSNNGDGTFTYTPPAGFTGSDEFAYTIADSDGDESTAIVAVTVNSATPSVFETRVAAGTDDAEERSSGSVTVTSSDLELTTDGTRQQTVGIRFTDIDIPAGAIITSAYIQFQTDAGSTGAVSLLIRGQDADNATGFTGAAFEVSSRATTDASVAWSPEDWTVRGEAGLAQRTPDLAAIIQEIVLRDGWAALNDMVFIITGTGTRSAESFDGTAAGAPLLHIEWLPAGPVSDPVAFDTPADADAGTNQIAELAAAGTPVGITAAATDPDAGDAVSYSIDDPRFAVDPTTGVVTRSGHGTLDFEAEPTVTLTVTATSSDFSTATRTFTIGVLDDEEPVAFNDPPDADAAANRIADAATEGTAVGITASARDPDAGDTIVYSITDERFAIDASGVITRSGTGELDAQAEASIDLVVRATSSDGTSATETFTVNVTSARLPSSLALVNTVNAWEWSPPSPDSSGIAYIAHSGTLLISDGEVNEVDLFTGDNLFEMSPGGSLMETLTTFGFSDEPTGVAYNPENRHLFFSDDTGTRSVYELNPGPDGLYDTSDDVVTSFATSAFGSSDPEGLAYDATRGVLYIVDGAGGAVYTVDPGQNGLFEGVESDDIITSFDTASLGIDDAEGIEYDPSLDILYINASRTAIAMVTPTGQLLGTLDTSAANASNPAGLALAPSSDDPNSMSLYMVDRGADSNAGAPENDGMVFEFRLQFEGDPPPEEPEALISFAVFGDYGDGGAGEAAVAGLVDSWNVDFVLTAGDNAYGSIPFDDTVGQFFSDYIGNYTGSYGSGSAINRFFPSLGDGDYDDDSAGLNGGIDTYLDYFTLPDNERYYDFQAGSVHFFALNSDSNEPDGNGAGSAQAQWFDAAAAASDAMFEIAYFHHTPYRSDGSGDIDMRWGFEAGGVDATFAGHSHDYDLVARDDNGDGVQLPYVTTGMGGFGETSPSSVGANLVTVTDAGMLIEFYLADGTLVDSHFVEAPAGGSPLFVNGDDVLNGSAGSDYLWGLGGDDTLSGFAGNDMLIGDDGDDLFVFNVGHGQDTVADFVAGAGSDDVLDLRDVGVESADQFLQVATNQGSDVVVDLGGGDQILFVGAQVAQFHDDDFLRDALVV